MKCKSVEEKQRILFIVNLLISYKETRDFAKVERKQKGTQKLEMLSKSEDLIISLFLWVIFLVSIKIMPSIRM